MQNCALSCATFGSYAIVKYTKIISFVSCGYDKVKKTCSLNESLGHQVKPCWLQRGPQKDAVSLKEWGTQEASTNTLSTQTLGRLFYKLFPTKSTKLIDISPVYRYPYALYFPLLIYRCCTGLGFHQQLLLLWWISFSWSQLESLQR